VAGGKTGLQEQWPKKANESQEKPRGTTRLESTYVRLFLWWSSGEAGLCEQQPKTAKGKPTSDLREPRGQLNGQTDSPA
jgi:hypothetical protein